MNVKMTELLNLDNAGESFSLTAKPNKQGHKIGKSSGKTDLSIKKGLSTAPDFQSQLQQQMKVEGESENALEQNIAAKPLVPHKQTFERKNLLNHEEDERSTFRATTTREEKEPLAPAAGPQVIEALISSSARAIPNPKQVHHDKAHLPVKAAEPTPKGEGSAILEKAPFKERLNEFAFLSHAPMTPSVVQPTSKPVALSDKNRDEREINIEASTTLTANQRPATAEMPSVSAAPSSSSTTFVEPTKEVTQLVSTLPPQALDDASLRAAVHPNVANISIDTGEAGALSVRLMVKDGVADVQLAGPAAPVIENRESELRVVLAQEGLSLGNFDSPQRDNSQQQRFERDELPTRSLQSLTPHSQTRSTEASPHASNGRVHIKA